METPRRARLFRHPRPRRSLGPGGPPDVKRARAGIRRGPLLYLSCLKGRGQLARRAFTFAPTEPKSIWPV